MFGGRSGLQAFIASALALAAAGELPAEPVPAPAPVVARAEQSTASPLECIPREECCKVCRKGRACGNTCIRADYQCHKGQGCACDADDVCR